jgi:alpha-L-fucosidase 2
LKYTFGKLIENTEGLMNFYQKHVIRNLLREIPDLPMGKDSTGNNIILPAYNYSKPFSKENAEMYSVFPYRIYGINKPDIALAKHTFNNRGTRFSNCWSQDAIQMAYLGRTDELRRDLKERANSLDEVTRFPAFWASAGDWKPDEDNGGNLMNAFQAMIVQAECTRDDKSILLFPAWPADWDVRFKLYAPLNTTIEGELKNGKLIYLNVNPKSREKDIIIEKKIK